MPSILSVALAALAVSSACAPAPDPRPNVLLIVVDTLRADHLGAYGYQKRETSPHIDELARSSLRFDRAYAAAAWTRPSIASILTGLSPLTHGANVAGAMLGEDIETLAETFHGAGFATAGVVSNAHLLREVGFAQGFDLWSEEHARDHEYVSSEAVTADALEMLAQLSDERAPWFLFVHYFDPHFAYIDHEDIAYAAHAAPLLQGDEPMSELRQTVDRWSDEDREFLLGRYDEEIRVTDAAIGELLGYLAASGADEETLIVFTADHGESFGERNEIGHGSLREEVIRVPLLLRPPRGVEARAIQQPVSLLSIAPTLLELAGVEHDADRFHAASLAEWLFGDPAQSTAGPVFSEILWKQGVVEGRYKLVLDTQRERIEVYDLFADPNEMRNLAGHMPKLSERLEGLIRQQTKLRRPAEGTPQRIDDAMRERLRGLGYTEEGAPDISPR